MVSPDLGPPSPRKVDLGSDQGTAAVTSKGELGLEGKVGSFLSQSEKRWNAVSTYSTDIY